MNYRFTVEHPEMDTMTLPDWTPNGGPLAQYLALCPDLVKVTLETESGGKITIERNPF